MSGTRSRFPTAPVIDPTPGPGANTDLLIVAHGERGGAGDNGALIRLSARIAGGGGFAGVRAGVLKGAPSLEAALGAGRGRALQVYPLFMSDGYYVRTAIPRRLGRAGGAFRMHRPLGLEPGLAAAIARLAARALAGEGRAGEGTVLLVGHGSTKSGESREAAEWQAARVRRLGMFGEVRTAFLENAPFLDQALGALPAGPCAVVGLFCGEGRHAGEDVPGAIEASGRADIRYAGPICAARETASLIADSVLARIGAAASRPRVY